MVWPGFKLLVEGTAKLIDGVAGLMGGVFHGTGSTAHGTGVGTKEVGKGAEEGLEHVGKGIGEVARGAGYAAEGLGHGAYAIGYTTERLGRWAKRKSKGYVPLAKDEFQSLLELEPEKQANQLERFVIAHKLEDEGELRVPIRYITSALRHYERVLEKEGGRYRGRHSPLEEELYKTAAVILIILGLLLFTPLTITGFAVYENMKGSITFLQVITGMVIAVAIYSFFKNK